MIPVTTNYDRTSPYRGYVEAKDGKIIVKLDKPIHEKEIFEVFGTIGFSVISYQMHDDGIYYKEFEICEFSYCVAKPVEPLNTVKRVGGSPLLALGTIFIVSGALSAAFITWGAHCGY